MEQRRTIVLYGASLCVAAIGAGLAARPDWRVVPMDSAPPSAAESLRQLRPDVVIFDLAAARPEAVVSLLQELPAVALIGVNLADHQALVLSSALPQLFTTDDVVRLIDAQPLAASPATESPIGGSQ